MIKPIKNDSRYTITQEWTGHQSGKPQYVVRFCGEFVGSSQFLASAIVRAIGHDSARKHGIIEGIPA